MGPTEVEIIFKVRKPLNIIETPSFKKKQKQKRLNSEFGIQNSLKMVKISNQKETSYIGLQVIQGKFYTSFHLKCVFLVQDDSTFLYLLDVVYFSFYHPTGRCVITHGNWMSWRKALSRLPPLLCWTGRVINGFANIHNYFVACCCAILKDH